MGSTTTLDVLVVGGGPAALAITTALAEHNLAVGLLSSSDRHQSWPNTYGIWAQEADALGLGQLLSHRWQHTVSHFGSGDSTGPDDPDRTVHHGRDYALFDKQRLQEHWHAIADRHGVHWWRGEARTISHDRNHSTVTCSDGTTLTARLVLDATGHQPVFVRRPAQPHTAGQAAYGVVARFKQPPINAGQFVFMDYRCAHLDADQKREPPTFLYAMHLGDDIYFVEETSLALSPPVPFGVLQRRLQQRLQHRGAPMGEILHEEFCLFPMDPPLPDLSQRVVGFGGAASMVHPASGYLVGSLLRRAPSLAAAIATALADPSIDGAGLAKRAWRHLWPFELRLKNAFYCFGLKKLMGFKESQLRHHFHSFFGLPDRFWYGFLTNTLNINDLATAMGQLFLLAPWDVRSGLLLPAKQPADWSQPHQDADRPGHSS